MIDLMGLLEIYDGVFQRRNCQNLTLSFRPCFAARCSGVVWG